MQSKRSRLREGRLCGGNRDNPWSVYPPRQNCNWRLDDGTHRSRLTCSFVPLEGEQSTAYCRDRRRWFDRFSTAATCLGDAQVSEAMPHNRTARIAANVRALVSHGFWRQGRELRRRLYASLFAGT